jgi:signal transduction histidine kinase/CheY-like chemotaxis protein
VTAFVGRTRERRQLRAALEDRSLGLLVVRGPSGVGKTALVDRVLHDLTPAAPILGRGKYAEQSTSAGLRPVVDALSQAVDGALGRLYDPAAGVASLRSLVGAQYDTLLAAGFRAAGLTAEAAPSPATALLSREGTVRLVDAMVRVLQWLDGFALPVVLFVDDWHRAPNEAVGFVHACSRRGSVNALKLVLAARSEGSMAYPQSASVVELEPLANADQLALLGDLLGEPAQAQAALDWLGDHANGLPFDLAEIALALRRERAFAGSGASLRVDPARAAIIDHRDINKIIIQRARTLPKPVLRVGIAAALWGDRADLDALGGCLSEPYDAVQAAAEALQANGLVRIADDEIVFPHDRIRASLLQVPDRAELQALAHAMSDVMLADGSGAHRQTALRLKLVGGLDDGRDSRLAGLFAREAAAARLAAQFDLAADFGEAAWSISQRFGGVDADDRLMVMREACLAAAQRRQAEAVRQRCALMIDSASNTAELANAYEWGVMATRLAGTASDAWALCREGLARFGVRLPKRIRNPHLVVAALVWKLVGRKARRLIRHDARTEQAVTAFANSAGYTAWEQDPRYAAYIGIRMATRARLMGYNSALWLSVDAFISSALKDYGAAAVFGDQAMASLPQLGMGRGMTLYRAVSFGKTWRDPRASLTDSNRQVYDFCMAEGDLVGAAYAVRNEALWSWRTAQTLEEMVATLEEADRKAERLGDATTRAEIVRLRELVRRLQQPEPLSSHLPDDVIHGKFVEPPLPAVEYLGLAEDWPAILRLADEFRARRHTLDSHPGGMHWRFFENLARLKTGLPLDRADLKYMVRVAKANPTDQLGKLLLLRAEERHRQGRKDCLRLYGEALEAMQRSSSRLEAGLAAECAAAAARVLGEGAAHERFRAAAAAIWSGLGAFAKLATYKTEQLADSVRARLAEAEAQAAIARRGEQAKSRFLAEVGHELRTPLQAMQGLLDLAAERPEELNLAEIRDVFGSLKSVVDDLTELGALGAEARLNARTTDLAALLSSELAFMQDAARNKGLVLGSDLAALEGRFFQVDPDRVRQVVRNLVSNAIKYTEAGDVTVRGSVAEGVGDQAHVALAVEDTGPGIPEERLPHLFEPFERAGREDARGLGLGLSLSRRIADRMGGSLTAENRAGKGSRFTFSFAAARGEAPSEARTTVRRLTILIVEDTTLVRRLMTRLLTIDGHVVIEAESLGQGLEQAGRHRFDLVLLDLHLPDGDGLSLIEQWPGGRERPSVIVLTAAVARETEERVMSAGATVLRKPIAAADLRTAIARACGGPTPSKVANGFDAEMAKLARDAREEIVKRAAELADLVRSDGPRAEIRRQAHKLAGLAAQFDAPRIAEAADRIEQACASGVPPRNWLAGLEEN